MVSVVPIRHRIEIECPGCNNKVSAIVFDRNIRVYVNDEDSQKTHFFMLGCPECHILFYKEK